MDTSVKLEIVVALATNYVIGQAGRLPWQGQLPADLARFRKLTLDHCVIMGRRTWESLPGRFRPLPQRQNIVVTRQERYLAPGAQTCSSLTQARQLCGSCQRVFVIGGAELYCLALPETEIVHLTLVHQDFEGEVTFPKLDLVRDWREVERQDFEPDSKNHFRHSFLRLERRHHD